MVGLPTEQAILIVNSIQYKDWESVAVVHEIMPRPAYRFRFTCSEDAPISSNFTAMRIRPGDECTIMLAGELAFTGLVSTRQVFYDARRHYIEIQGVNYSDITSVTSTVTKTQEFKDVTIEQFMRAMLSPYSKFKLVVEGGSLPQTKFPRINIPHGMSTFDVIDMHLRSLGSFGITSNPHGDFVVIAGQSGGSDTVREGKDIIEGREIIYNQAAGMSGAIPALGQFPGDDKSWGAKVASIPFFSQTFQGFANSQGYGPLVSPLEVPAWTNQHTQGRSNAERNWQQQDEITVTVTVYGWLRPSGGLWQRNQIVGVVSPMLIMQGNENLKAMSITFMQDNNIGTRTQLMLQNDEASRQSAPALGR